MAEAIQASFVPGQGSPGVDLYQSLMADRKCAAGLFYSLSSLCVPDATVDTVDTAAENQTMDT